MPDDVFPCLSSVAFFSLLFGFLAFMRFLRYRETIALAEKGLVAPPRATTNGKESLRWGIAIVAIGLALCLGLWPLGAILNVRAPFGFGPWMLVGLIPTFFGLALILIYVLTREDKPTVPKDDSAADHVAPPMP